MTYKAVVHCATEYSINVAYVLLELCVNYTCLFSFVVPQSINVYKFKQEKVKFWFV